MYKIGQVDCFIALWMVLGLVDGFGIGNVFVLVYSIDLVNGFGIGYCFVLVYSIGLLDCFSLVEGFRSGGWLWNMG